MAAVIQATCPGCKKILRIPSNWVQQAIRCKHCGLVMAVKKPVAAQPTAQTPPSQAVRPTPLPPTIGKATLPPRVPVAKLVTPTADSVPVAIPVAPIAAFASTIPSSASPFEDLDDSGLTVKPLRRKAKSGSGLLKGLVIVLGVLFLSSIALGVMFTVAWPCLKPVVMPSPQVAEHHANVDKKDNNGDATTTPKAEPIKPPEPVKKPEPKQPEPKQPDSKKPDPVVKQPEPKQPDSKQPDPKQPDPKKPDPIVKQPNPKEPVPAAGTQFPRRALVVSVHNYLYANPVGGGLPIPGARNMSYFVTKLNTGLRVPLTQIAHLSDEAGKDKSRAPNKQVIEKTLLDFLSTSRDQDRVLVFLIGHAVEIEGEAYFVPIEGELGNAMTLIPLKWVYEELKNCKARQKILVLDACRFNPSHGIERPNSGPMSAKFDDILKTPPDGVQVWTSCVAEQMSYETDNSVVGMFIDKLTGVLEKGMAGSSQRPEESIPMDKLNESASAAMKDELTKYKLTQTPRLTGKEMDGAAYDPKVEPPKPPVLAASANNQANLKLIQSVLTEISTPPVKGGNHSDATIKVEMLPPFSEKAMMNYRADEESMLEKPIQAARAMLWAVSNSNPPEALKQEFEVARGKLNNKNLAMLRDGFRYPQNENQLKTEIANHSRDVADIIDELQQAYKKLKEVEFDREKEPKRWVANYDFMVARMEEQIAYLYEYQSMLGQMRKELPPIERPLYNGWKLASTATPSGDTTGKKMAKSSAKLLDKMAEENKGTPWEVLAKREKMTTLGLEWKAATVK